MRRSQIDRQVDGPAREAVGACFFSAVAKSGIRRLAKTEISHHRIDFRLYTVRWNNAAFVRMLDQTSFSVSSDELAARQGAALSVPDTLPLFEAPSQHYPSTRATCTVPGWQKTDINLLWQSFCGFFFCFFRASQKTAPFFQLLKGAVSVQRCLGVSQAAVHNLDCSRCSKTRMNSCQAPLPAAHTDVPRPSQTQPVAQKYPQICLELSVSALFGS